MADSPKQVLLLGAGASVDAGIKGAFDMTKEFLRLFSEDRSCQQKSHALRYVVGGLMMQKGARGEDPFEGVNIEDVFNAMQTLATRQLFEAAPFVAGWHPIVEELDTIELQTNIRHQVSEATQMVNIRVASRIDSAISEAINQRRFPVRIGSEIRKMVEDSLRHLTSTASGGGEQAGGGRLFHATCDTMIQKLISLVWLQPENAERVEYLRPLVRHACGNDTPIATLNYDTAIEVAAQAEGVDLISYMGADPINNQGMPKAVLLLKLHGSINWRSGRSSSHALLPETHVTHADANEMAKPGYMPAVIFGQRNKLTAEGPFLSLLSRFQQLLARANELIIIGYSLRDDHINESIAAWFNKSSVRTITLITTKSSWGQQSDFAGRLSRFAAPGGRVRVVIETAAKAIPGLFPASNVPA